LILLAVCVPAVVIGTTRRRGAGSDGIPTPGDPSGRDDLADEGFKAFAVAFDLHRSGDAQKALNHLDDFRRSGGEFSDDRLAAMVARFQQRWRSQTARPSQ